MGVYGITQVDVQEVQLDFAKTQLHHLQKKDNVIPMFFCVSLWLALFVHLPFWSCAFCNGLQEMQKLLSWLHLSQRWCQLQIEVSWLHRRDPFFGGRCGFMLLLYRLSKWLTFKLLGITCLVGKIKFKLLAALAQIVIRLRELVDPGAKLLQAIGGFGVY